MSPGNQLLTADVPWELQSLSLARWEASPPHIYDVTDLGVPVPVCRGRETQSCAESPPCLYYECFCPTGNHKYKDLVSLPGFSPKTHSVVLFTVLLTFAIDECFYWIPIDYARARWSCAMDEVVILWSIRSICSAQSSAGTYLSILPANLSLGYTVYYAKSVSSMERRNTLFTYSIYL